MFMNRSLNSDGQLFHLTSLNSKTTATYANRNQGPDLR